MVALEEDRSWFLIIDGISGPVRQVRFSQETLAVTSLNGSVL